MFCACLSFNIAVCVCALVYPWNPCRFSISYTYSLLQTINTKHFSSTSQYLWARVCRSSGFEHSSRRANALWLRRSTMTLICANISNEHLVHSRSNKISYITQNTHSNSIQLGIGSTWTARTRVRLGVCWCFVCVLWLPGRFKIGKVATQPIK